MQTLSVSKAGIVCSLNCRATILATCNPKHKFFDNDKPLTYNTGIEVRTCEERSDEALRTSRRLREPVCTTSF